MTVVRGLGTFLINKNKFLLVLEYILGSKWFNHFKFHKESLLKQLTPNLGFFGSQSLKQTYALATCDL